MSENEVLSFGQVMIFIHMAITRGLRVTVEQGTRLAAKSHRDPAIQAGFALYAGTLIVALRAHHMSEDAVAFPRLRALLPDVPFDKLIADHRTMDGWLGQLEKGAHALEAEEEEGTAAGNLAEVATLMSDVWHPHIQIEEGQLYAAHVTATLMNPAEDAEFSRSLGEYAQAHAQPLSLTMPFLVYNLPAQERGVYTASMPPTVMEQLISLAWKDEWAPMQPFLLE